MRHVLGTVPALELFNLQNRKCMYFWQPEIWHIITNNPEELSGGLICALIVGGKCGKWEEANSWFHIDTAFFIRLLILKVRPFHKKI